MFLFIAFVLFAISGYFCGRIREIVWENKVNKEYKTLEHSWEQFIDERNDYIEMIRENNQKAYDETTSNLNDFVKKLDS